MSVYWKLSTSEWFQHFEICCRANRWDNDKLALKLPSLLVDEVLAVWLELTEEEQKDYSTMKKKIIDTIKPMSFISLDDFHKWALHPEEPLSLYIHELKELLNQAILEITAHTKEQLLLHQFLTGLSHEVSKQLRAMGATDTLKTALERAKILMTVEQHTPVNPVAAAQPKLTTEFHQLQQQITELTAQVVALTTRQASPRTPPAFR